MADAEKNKESSAPEDVLEIENAEPTAETASDTIVTKKE